MLPPRLESPDNLLKNIQGIQGDEEVGVSNVWTIVQAARSCHKELNRYHATNLFHHIRRLVETD